MGASSIVIAGLAGTVLAVAALAPAARAAEPERVPGTVSETSPVGAPVRTYSNGARVPVPQPGQAGTVDAADPTATGSVEAAPRRVPNPNTRQNPLGCPEIDPLCQGR